MSSSIDLEKLAVFLVIAKFVTYASGNDEISVLPVLANSHQLEYLDEPLFYEEPFWGDKLQRRHTPRH